MFKMFCPCMAAVCLRKEMGILTILLFLEKDSEVRS